MRVLKRTVAVTTALLTVILSCSQALLAQELAERVKEEMTRAAALEKAGKYAEAVDVYRDILGQGGLEEKSRAEVIERMLSAARLGQKTEYAVALARGTLEGIRSEDARARIRLALARTLVRSGQVMEAENELAEVSASGMGGKYAQDARRLIGDELLNCGNDALASKQYAAAETAFKAAMTFAREEYQRDRGKQGYIKVLVLSGKKEEAGRLVEQYMDDARAEGREGTEILTKVRYLLLLDDVAGAQEAATAMNRMPDASEYNITWARYLIAEHLQDEGKKRSDKKLYAKALQIYDALLADERTPRTTYDRCMTAKLRLMPLVDEPPGVVRECDRMLTDVRMKLHVHLILMVKVDAQLRAGDRDGARRTAAALLGHPSITAYQKGELSRLFGGDLPKPEAPKLGERQLEEALHEYERLVEAGGSESARGTAALEMISLLAETGRREEAIETANDLLVRISERSVRQNIYRGMHNAYLSGGDVENAGRTVLRMLEEVQREQWGESRGPRLVTGATITDFARYLREQGKGDRAALVMAKLGDYLNRETISAEEKRWGLETLFSTHKALGDPQAALVFFRRHATEFKVPPPGLPEVVSAAASLAHLTELRAAEGITMGKKSPSGTYDDVLFAAKWYFANNPEGATTAHAKGLFMAVETACKKAGDLGSAARLIEDVVRSAPEDDRTSEEWKYRAAEFYLAAKRPEDARRALLELQAKWPRSKENAQMLLARIDAGASDGAARIERLKTLHSEAQDSKVWFESGIELVKLYQQEQRWDDALALQKEMGKKDPHQLLLWAYDEGRAKRHEQALALFTQLREQSPGNGSAYRGQFGCLNNLKRSEEAARVCEAAWQHFPPGDETHQWGLLMSARQYYTTFNDYRAAEERFRKYVTLYPNAKDVEEAEVGLISSLNKLGQAREALERSKRLLPKSSSDKTTTSVRWQMSYAYKDIILALEKDGKGSEAVDLCNEFVSILGNATEARRHLADAFLGLIRPRNAAGKYEEAGALCRKFPMTPANELWTYTVRLELARSQLGLGKGREVIALLESAATDRELKRDKYDSGLLLLFAEAHLVSGDKLKAVEFAREVIGKHAQNARAVQAAEALLKKAE